MSFMPGAERGNGAPRAKAGGVRGGERPPDLVDDEAQPVTVGVAGEGAGAEAGRER